jgi:membrane-associated phospholipid phosphatase
MSPAVPRKGALGNRYVLLTLLILAFAALSFAVLAGWPFGVIDKRAQSISQEYFTGYRAILAHYVLLGQRGPTVKAAAVWFVLLSLWRRTPDSLILFVLAELANNLLVGAVKVGTGRWGPRATVNVHDILSGGDIFPSGHVSNAVVLFGVLALTAHRHRRLLAAVAIWVAGSVGVATVLLDTHWVTDVVGGWMAGGIVLLCLPRHEGLTRRLLALPRRASDAAMGGGPEPSVPAGSDAPRPSRSAPIA